MFGAAPDTLDEDASFLDSGIIDSTGVMELVGFLEDRFGISVEDAELTPENLDRLAVLGQKLDLSALQGQMDRMRTEFDDACWLSLNDHLRLARSAGALRVFLAECPGNPHAREAREMLTQMLAGIRFSEWPFDEDEARRSQSLTAEVLGVPSQYQMVLPGGTMVEFVLVPAGEFIMGCAGQANAD